MTSSPLRAAVYARVSTFDQEPENQLQELRRYVEARGWTGQEFVDRGVSGSKENRPALDALLRDAKRRKFDVLVCWRLDRLGRNLRHLVTLLEELQTLGVTFVSLGEGIDCTTPAGKLQLHISVEQQDNDRLFRSCLKGVNERFLPNLRAGANVNLEVEKQKAVDECYKRHLLDF